MPIFGFGKRSKSRNAAEPVSVDVSGHAAPVQAAALHDIRRQLFAAACAFAGGDEAPLRSLCRTHERLIRAQAALPVHPSAIRANPRLLRWYRDGLIAIADYCANSGRNSVEPPGATAS